MSVVWEWLKRQGLGIVRALVRKQAAQLVMALLLKLDPSQWADALRPYVRSAFETSGPDWQAAARVGWGKIGEFMDELLDNPDVGT